jgi:sterol-4alpha-carboxylate 3-dehydrogenase (decarboxylating)
VYTSSASVILGATEPLVNADERWPIVAGDAQPEYYTTTKVRQSHAVKWVTVNIV